MKKSVLVAACAVAIIAWFIFHQGESAYSLSGSIEVDEVRVASRSGGRVEKIFAAEGDSLTNGQVIAELDAGEISAHRDMASARLAELEAGPRAEDIAAAKAEWDALRADAEFANDEAKRRTALADAKTISKSELDEAVSHAASLKEKVAAAQKHYDVLAAGTRREDVDQARAQLAEIESSVAELRVVAPADSTLEVLYVKIGDVVPPNGSLATLLYQNERWLRVYVPEPWLTKLKPGTEATLRVDGFPGQTFKGVIQQINRKAEFTPRNIQTPEERIKQVFGVKIKVLDDGGLLRAGMTAEVRFEGVE